ncbi:MAG: hypothetical protein SNJ49_08490 [Chloracidobacterium sp.]
MHFLAAAFGKLLRKANPGTVVYVRDAAPDIIHRLPQDTYFTDTLRAKGWQVYRVAARADEALNTITSDQAVAQREAKGTATLLLVERNEAGPGMDGIYSAGREIQEDKLLDEACHQALQSVASPPQRAFLRALLKDTQTRLSHRSRWLAFDFLARVVKQPEDWGAHLWLLGRWPVVSQDLPSQSTKQAALHRAEQAARLVTDLFGAAALRRPLAERLARARVQTKTEAERQALQAFLEAHQAEPTDVVLKRLRDRPEFWLGRIETASVAEHLTDLTLSPWRAARGSSPFKWSGLNQDPETQALVWPIHPNAEDTAALQVKWKTTPAELPPGSVTYHLALVDADGAALFETELTHAGKNEEKFTLTAEDLPNGGEGLDCTARLVLTATQEHTTITRETEWFTIRAGEVGADAATSQSRRWVRAFSEGLIELDSPAQVAARWEHPALAESDAVITLEMDKSRSYGLRYPALFAAVERAWADLASPVVRWTLTVRESGFWRGTVSPVNLVPGMETPLHLWQRVHEATSKLVQHVQKVKLNGLTYVEPSPQAEVIGAYLDAWCDLLAVGEPELALVSTVAVSDGRRVRGLIVLPTHPLRLAWHAAYDALLLHARFQEQVAPKTLVRELRCLDGMWFPAWLPGVEASPAFVFADTLGFHAAALVPEDDPEPRVTTTLLARALENCEKPDDRHLPRTLADRAVTLLGDELRAYAAGHPYQKLLHIHALRAGDGQTVTRALGQARRSIMAVTTPATDDDDDTETPDNQPPAFVLHLHASPTDSPLAGQFLRQLTLRRRLRGSSTVPSEDRWVSETTRYHHGVTQPNLQWIQSASPLPETPGHVGIIFDLLTSQVRTGAPPPNLPPAGVCGLLSRLCRVYHPGPVPRWEAFLPDFSRATAHPADAPHTVRLCALQSGLGRLVARYLHLENGSACLTTTLSETRQAELRHMHECCDWVVTLDHFAGVEYFDHPHAHSDVYAAHVIDCVPDRDDVADLRLVASTALIAEVEALLAELAKRAGCALDARTAPFLLARLKEISRRLPIRLAGAEPPAEELLALAAAGAYCRAAEPDDPCWVALRNGVLIPVDDIPDLLPEPRLRRSAAVPERRADFLYVTGHPSGQLVVRFIEVKYRRAFEAFSPEQVNQLLDEIRAQVEATRKGFLKQYLDPALPPTLRLPRLARLALVVQSYADKARRHHLEPAGYDALYAACHGLLEGRGDVVVAAEEEDRGWVCSPSFAGPTPLEVSRAGWPVRTFRFGLPALDVPDQEDNHPEDSHQADHPEDNSKNGAVGVGGPPAEPLPPGDVEPAIVLGRSRAGHPVSWKLTIKGNPHLLVVGLPGMGKTTCLLNICAQMHRQRVCPLVFSYHQDFDEKLQSRIPAVDLLEVGRLSFNPLAVTTVEHPRAYVDVAGATRDIFAAMYPDLGDLQLGALRRAIVESFEERGWSTERVGETPPFGRFVELLRQKARQDASLRRLLTRLDELEDYGFFKPPPTEPARDLWQRTAPVVVCLHREQSEVVQSAFAMLVLYQLYKDMFRRGVQSRITHAIMFDEAHRARRLKLIPTVAKECRKYGISLVLASQEARDFDPSVFSAVGSQLVLRVNEADAKALVRNMTATGQARSVVDQIKSMPKFQALYFSEQAAPQYCHLLADAD